MNKQNFLNHVPDLKQTNNFQLYDTVLKQTVYRGTHKQCERVLQTNINPMYHKDFVIVEVNTLKNN